jgi:UDP-N-acetylmuramoylalanine--D-glutamate ligase
MMPPPDLTGKRVTVAGAARSGIAAAELLVSVGAQVTVSDSREQCDDAGRLRQMGAQLELGGHRIDTFARADLVVLSPGVPPEREAVRAARDQGVPVIAEIELAFRFLRGRVIAITGTKGKSTTTSLTGRMLDAAGFHVCVGGNIGLPLSSQVPVSTPGTLHVVEASSFQLEQIDRFHPWIAVMLNFSPDHLDRHETVDAYRRAKARVFEHQTPEDWAVVNADDPIVLDMARQGRAATRLFSRHQHLLHGTTVEAGWVVSRDEAGSSRLLPVSAVRLIGPHLLDDVLAAAAVGVLAGVAPPAMAAAVETFRGLEHAMELVAEVQGVRFINDSKATNVDAARRSVESFEGGVVPIMGGRYKGGDFRNLRLALTGRARAVVTIGEAAGQIEDAIGDLVPVHRAPTMEDAVAAAFDLARPSGVVLLAPACSSFDMFEDYAARGRRFKEEVTKVAARSR